MRLKIQKGKWQKVIQKRTPTWNFFTVMLLEEYSAFFALFESSERSEASRQAVNESWVSGRDSSVAALPQNDKWEEYGILMALERSEGVLG